MSNNVVTVLLSEKTIMQRKQKRENSSKQRQKQKINSEYTSKAFLFGENILYNLCKDNDPPPPKMLFRDKEQQQKQVEEKEMVRPLQA